MELIKMIKMMMQKMIMMKMLMQKMILMKMKMQKMIMMHLMMMIQKMILIQMMMMQQMIQMMMIMMQTPKLVTESGEESEEEKPCYFDRDVDDSDDKDCEPKKESEKQQKLKPKNVEKLRIKSPELSQTLSVDSSEVMPKVFPKQGPDLLCLFISEADNDIVECDNCGVVVHESCYDISDNQSTASTVSSARTEPWFCDACKDGVKPICELCPNEGGIFKETDAGKWVHLVCALYTHSVVLVMNLMEEDGLISHWLSLDKISQLSQNKGRNNGV